MADGQADEVIGNGLTTALTTVEVVGANLIVAKRRVSIDRWHVDALAARARDEARALTEQEGRWLAAARHRGVIQLRRVQGGAARLETDFATGSSLRTVRLTWAQVATALESVANTLAELHQGGLVHANLAPEHVIVGPEGRHPRLCSPRPWAAERGPAEDLAELASMADSFGAAGHRPSMWTTAVESLASCTDLAAAADLFASLARPRSPRLRRQGRGQAPLPDC
jgi:hypothetical protein